jgi:AcrR family transcriptional regulator
VTTEGRALRRDAQCNLARILAAARDAFAERGADACVAEIARRAGVGNATIFRRFATKEDLVVAVVEARLREHLAEACWEAAEDPGSALRAYLEAMIGWQVEDRALMDSMGARLGCDPRLRALHDSMVEVAARLLAAARAAQVVRQDLEVEDLVVLGTAIARIGAALEPSAPGGWRRYLDILFDGVSAGGGTGRSATGCLDVA